MPTQTCSGGYTQSCCGSGKTPQGYTSTRCGGRGYITVTCPHGYTTSHSY